MPKNKTLDLTPTWQQLLPLLLHLHESAMTDEARKVARDELRRMAKIADMYVAEHKEK